MKKLTALACLLAMLISLTACAAASTPETTAAPETAATEAPTTEATEAPTEAAVPVRLGAMTDAERQILADGCLINYYKNH